MAGLGLPDLPRPPANRNPALDPRFEGRSQCRKLDCASSRTLVRASSRPDLLADSEEVLRLAHKLDYASRGEPPPESRASRLFYGDERMRIGGAGWDLIERTIAGGIQVSFVTLCPRNGDTLPANFDGFDPRAFGRQLGRLLDRRILRKRLCRTGWSILFLDCEYQLIEGVFRFHWHGFASGGELEAIDELRHTRNYVSKVPAVGEDRDTVRTRLRMTREPLYDVGYLCTYPIKPEWWARAVASNQEANRKRSRKLRLPEPYRTMGRLFFDRHPIGDITVVRGLRVTREGLIETR